MARGPSLRHQECEAAAVSPRLVLRQSDTLGSGIRRPPQAPHVFNETAESINKTVEEYAQWEKNWVDDLAKSVSVENATFDNLVLPWAEHEAETALRLAYFAYFANFHPDKNLRDTADAISPALTNVSQQTLTREDVSKLFNTVYDKQQNDTNLDAESRLYLEKVPQDFNSSGLGVEAGPKRDRYLEISRRLQVLSNEYLTEVIKDNTTLWFTREELPGVKPDILDTLIEGDGPNQGKLGVLLQDPSTGDVSSYCTNETTRKAIAVAGDLVAPSNVGRLEEALALRDEQARLAEQPNYSTWTLTNMMAKTPAAVQDLQQKVQDAMTPKLPKEIETLKQMKNKTGGDASHLYRWDVGLYSRLVIEEASTLDLDKQKEYFPAAQTVHRILDLYAELFGIKFVKIAGQDLDELSPTGNGTELTWHPDVELFAVWDSTSSEEFLGYLYLDAYFREGKRDNAYMIPLEPGFCKDSGERHYPVAGLYTNFRKAAANATRPSLMSRGEVSTLMHEAGHGMHQLLSKTRFSRFHGPNGCPLDWLEMPSQMMEEFAYAPDVLKRLSQHYTRIDPKYAEAWKKNNTELPPETLPDAAISDMVKNKVAFSAGGQIGQIALGKIDQIYHTPKSQEDAKKINTTKIWNDEFTAALKTEGQGIDGGHGQTSFTHIMQGYDAKYYAYLWSRVYAIDAYYTAFKANPINPEAGRRWREEVLQIGGATDDLQGVLDKFLGHEAPDLNPTLEAYGVKK
ncbi:hypothetical protein CKM354_000894200 [Cercospora kikuchii]|uniref:Peptidase M3A/M3B catalytic domain-containing protein n=1 Tax=Cercospora kikuchii TaxID=84275 RepID=A0A9P3CJV9_9PEZI|nr:uncharacterized protein CKM354_000894200 [Cercospora kikuchii]GIZ45789.1 hypothetical protein CKM354_000894200 [Cercospora kikuchii]